MNDQARKEREITEDELRSTQSPQLVSALDKKSQLMKIATIQPYAKPLKKRFFYTYEANNNIDNQEKSILENLRKT